MTTKLRADAWEAPLAEETRRELYRLTKPPSSAEAAEGRPYLRDFERDVRPYLSLRGITEPSRAGWYRFLGRMREEEAAQTVISVETSKRIAQGITASKIDPRLAADMMTSLSVDEAAKPAEERNEKVMQIFAASAAMFNAAAQKAEELALKGRAQETKDAQLKLAREKFEAAERRESAAKGAISDAKLTDEQRMAKLREIYGI